MKETCYICGKEKNSVEHAPAKCFFPKKGNYRNNLITVPSCREHNEDTSKDDEYVQSLICMSIGTNAVAFKQFIERVQKSFVHSPALKAMMLEKKMPVYVEQGGVLQKTLALQIDRQRFDKIMKKISYALYYHEYDKTWQRGLFVETTSLLQNGLQNDAILEIINEARETIKQDLDGNNPEVFRYKFFSTETEDVVLWMCFYEGFDVVVVPNTSTNCPDF